ncbi:MAG: alpha/beta hydrolase family protein [Candidatus Acidiferrales bacterium]
MPLLLCGLTAILAGTVVLAQQQQPSGNASIDPEHIFFTEPVPNPVTVVTEPVKGSDTPVQIIYVETRDGLYAPIGLRKPPGKGPFPIILFAHMNGGMGVRWIREWTQNGSWTLEQFLKAGYAVAWMRYRAEVNNSYGARLEEKTRERRQLFNRGPLEYDDAISIIKYVKTLPYIDPNRVGYLGLSHGGEMLMKITSEYDGLRAGIAVEPASGEFLARKAPPRKPGEAAPPETFPVYTEEMQKQATALARSQMDMSVTMARIRPIDTPILIMGRERDHNQAIFRANYELLREAGKNVEWKSYEHPEHGFIFVRRNAEGVYDPGPTQVQAVKDAVAYFDGYMKK